MQFGPIIEGVTHSLDLFVRRHGLIAQNVAHIDTPGYRPQDLDFARALESAFVERAPKPAHHPGHLPLNSPLEDGEVVTDETTPPGRDGNAVDIDRETARLAQNSLRYETALRVLDRKLSLLKYAATDGGSK
jgi:flagellar basal-body rod protein FlgB